VVGLSLTLLRWQMLLRADRAHLAAQQSLEANAVVDRLSHRFNAFTLVLKGASGYLAREPRPTRSEWRTYVESLGLFKSRECVQAMSFVTWIPLAQADAHIQQMKAEGFPDYAILPGGSLPPDPEGLSSIVYLEPMGGLNERAFGRDMWGDPLRREAMSQARDSGSVVLSRKLVLYQEGNTEQQPGVVLYAPVYRSLVPLDTVDQRRMALLGWTTIVLRMGDFMESLFLEEAARMDIHVQEGGPSDAGAVLFDSDHARSTGSDQPSHQRSFEMLGRTWTIQIRQNTDLLQLNNSRFRVELLLGGTFITLFTCLMAFLITGSERRARALAGARGEELRATESQFRALFEKAPFGMAIVASDTGRFQAANTRLGEVLGYTPEELLERDFQSHTHPDHLASDLGSVRDLATGAIDEVHKEKRYVHRDGHTVWARLSMVRLPSLEGAPPRHLAIVEDITEAQNRDEQLRGSEALFRALYDLLPVGVALKDPSGRILQMNLACQALMGVRPEDYLDAEAKGPFLNVVRPDGTPLPPEEYASSRAMKEGRVENLEMGVLKADGSTTWMQVTAERIQEPRSGVLVVYTDISERRRMEAALKVSEERWSYALDGAGDGVWDWRADSETMFMSRGYKVMLGYGPDEYIDHTFNTWIEWLHPADRERVLSAVNDFLEQPTSNYQIEYRLRRKDGDYTWVLARGKAVAWNETGRPTRMIGTHSDISERKWAETALLESEARFRSVVEQSPVAIFLHEGGNFTFLNPAALRLFGTDRSGDLLGTPVLARVHPDDLDLVRLRIAHGLQQGKPNPLVEQRLIALDGTMVEAEVQAIPVTYSGQANLMVFAQDISVRKRAEAALRTNETRLRMLSDQIPDSFLYQFGLDGTGAPRFDYISAGVERLCGVKAEEVLRDPLLLFHQMDPAMLSAYQEAEAVSARDLTPFTLDFRNRRADGEWRWFRVRSAPRKTQDGSLSWEGIATDITKQKVDQLRLEESETRFRRVVENAGDAIFLLDEEGRILLSNRAACDSLGYTMEELLQFSIGTIDSSFMEKEAVLARRSMVVGRSLTIQSLGRRKDGSVFPVEVRFGLLQQEPRQFLSLVRDLSERVQGQESELRARKAESLVLMAGGIAHDFNNLFQALQGNLEVAQLRASQNGLLQEPLTRAMGVLNRAVSLSWKMLDFSGHGFLQMEALDLEHWLPTCLATLQLEFPPTFHWRFSSEPSPAIRGDRSKLQQVLKAVLDNAREAAKAGGSQIHIRLCADFGGDRPGPDSPGIWPLRRPALPATVCLEIRDEGPGVPPEQLDLVCDPFFTTKEPGRGLGLPAAVGILRAHRAGLHILNGEGGGLILRMHFPPSGA
jgi:PAS domain S-box-containing protein